MLHKKVSPWSLCLKHDDRDHPPRIGKEPFHLVWKVILTRKIFSCLIIFNNLNEKVRPPPVESKKAFKLLGEPSSSNLTKTGIQNGKQGKPTLCVPSTCLASRHWPAPGKPIDGTKSYPQSMCSSQSVEKIRAGRCLFKGSSLVATVRLGGQLRMEVATVGSSHAHSDCQPVPHDVQEELQKGKF